MSNLKKILFILFLGVFVLVGCDGDPAPNGPPPPPPYPNLPENASLIQIGPEAYQIATPLAPSFMIWDGILTSCLGQDYIVLDIGNMGPWAFQRAWMTANSNTQSFYTGWDETPFHGSGGECPVGNGTTSLPPGGSSHLYIPVEYTFGTTTKFDIRVTLCTYLGNDSDPPFPNHSNRCPYREYTIELYTYTHVFVEIRAENVCPIGPDPLKYEVISSLFPGEIVELLGRAKEPGWLVVLNSKYNVPCFFPEDDANIPDEEAGDSRDEEFDPGPEKDTSCPQGEKYDFILGECVEKDKCGPINNYKTCTAENNCKWDRVLNKCVPE